MADWKTYKVYMPWKQEEYIYMVGRRKDEFKPDWYDNIEWNGFYSKDADECKRFAHDLNRKEQQNEE